MGPLPLYTKYGSWAIYVRVCVCAHVRACLSMGISLCLSASVPRTLGCPQFYPFFSPSLVFTPSPVVTTIVFSFCAFLLFVCFPCFLFILLLPCPSYCIFLECILYFYFLNFLSLGNLNLPFFSPLNNFYWTLVDLQCCVSFYYAAK